MFDLIEMIGKENIAKGRYWKLPLSLVSGCTRCSPGCTNCWALAMEKRFNKGEEGKIQIHPERLGIPLRRKKPTVFSLWNDLFHEDVPQGFIWDALDIMRQCPQHIFLILTKRPRRMLEFVTSVAIPNHGVLPNVWLGCTVVNQQEADEKIPILLQIQAAVRWISIEPMLGEIDLLAVPAKNVSGYAGLKLSDMLHLVIVGGETGPGARPMKEEWATSIVNQCKAAGVPVFVKQIHCDDKVGNKWKQRVSKNMDEWPCQLKVRELPEGGEMKIIKVESCITCPYRLRFTNQKASSHKLFCCKLLKDIEDNGNPHYIDPKCPLEDDRETTLWS